LLRLERSNWTGIRPLVMEDQSGVIDTKSVSRRHVIEQSKSGLISLMGGKWTIYRQMG
jgi:glycerol-3-phosphate dehydrogenase